MQKKITKTILVAADTNDYDVASSLEELSELTKTADGEVAFVFVQKLDSVNKATYIGQGKLAEIKEFCKDNEITLAIFDCELSGSQIRNIENELENVRVIDRTMLILDIFAMRAVSNEGKLQVELAQQKYMLPRLTGEGTSLSRLGGGIGTRGPGETKLETDKRHIRRRIATLTDELKEMEKRRDMIKKRRKKNNALSVAVVGYTNVGKSTLMNFLTDAGVLTENKLFATLDPTARELKLPDGQKIILIDTVGLIRRLPHTLVEAFKSTLEEAKNADLILNVCDASCEMTNKQIEVTNEVLKELDCANTPVINVYNKCDILNIEPKITGEHDNVFISAKEGQGIELLFECINEKLSHLSKRTTLLIPYEKGGIIDIIRKNGNIFSEDYTSEGIEITALIKNEVIAKFEEYKKED